MTTMPLVRTDCVVDFAYINTMTHNSLYYILINYRGFINRALQNLDYLVLRSFQMVNTLLYLFIA